MSKKKSLRKERTDRLKKMPHIESEEFLRALLAFSVGICLEWEGIFSA